MNIQKRLSTLKATKQEGHDLIDEIVKTGITKTTAYAELRTRLGCIEGREHFQNVFTIREANDRVRILDQMLADRKATVEANREKRKLAMRERRAKERAEAGKDGLIPQAIAKAPKTSQTDQILPLAEQRAIHARQRALRASREARARAYALATKAILVGIAIWLFVLILGTHR